MYILTDHLSVVCFL